jgi:hypothetical protein
MWFKKDKDKDDEAAESSVTHDVEAEVADLEDARGSAEVTEGEAAEGSDDGYQSRHAGGVDDSGVLADAPDSGSPLPGDGAVTDESAVAQSAGTDADSEADSEAEDAARAEAERREREEAFAREHDPSDHDVAAGEEFRQRGDWTADEHGGPQVQEPDGTLHDPGDHGAAEHASDGESASHGSSGESSLDDIRDGGHGWGSAAPIEGGAQPLGHPVKAWHDTMTYVQPGEPGYEADPHVWFVDGEIAQRAGFRAAHGG